MWNSLRYLLLTALAGVFMSGGVVFADPGKQSSSRTPWTAVLTKDMDEAEVRETIGEGDRGDRFQIQPGASWTLKDTLVVPVGVELIGNSVRGADPTFRKGFDGPLARIESFTTIRGVYFEGNKEEYDGHGVVTANGCREVETRRLTIRNCAGSGFVPRTHYQSRHVLGNFGHNDGYGVKHEMHHHTNLYWDSCHVGDNGRGGVAYNAVDKNSVWENCIIIRNPGPGVVQDMSEEAAPDYKQTNNGIRQVVFKDCAMMENAGPAFLSRKVRKSSWGIVFEDTRFKRNAFPGLRNKYEWATKPEELTEPIGGAVHLEHATVDVEFRGAEISGGNGTDNETTYRATGETIREIDLVIEGATRGGKAGHNYGPVKDIIGPETILTTTNARLLQGDVEVKAGTGLHGRKGVVDY